jgi:hypothetical protein
MDAMTTAMPKEYRPGDVASYGAARTGGYAAAATEHVARSASPLLSEAEIRENVGHVLEVLDFRGDYDDIARLIGGEYQMKYKAIWSFSTPRTRWFVVFSSRSYATSILKRFRDDRIRFSALGGVEDCRAIRSKIIELGGKA